MKHSANPKPNYLARVIGLHLHLPAGSAVEVFVAHDSDCPRLRGGACTCQPDMTVAMPDGQRAEIDDMGDLGQCGGVVVIQHPPRGK